MNTVWRQVLVASLATIMVFGVVLNASLDPADGVRLMLHTSANEIHVTSEACDANETCDTITVASTERDGPYSVFQIPHMPPWSLLLINV